MRSAILNIDMGRIYDLRHEDVEVHGDRLGRMADFFGHNMVAHRHARVFQVHLLEQGEVHVRLDDSYYHARAPLFFLTPPSVTHAFVMSDDADGYVLSVRQNVLWDLFAAEPTGLLGKRLNQPLCIELQGGDADEVRKLFNYCALICSEYTANSPGRDLNLLALTRLGFVSMARLASASGSSPNRSLRQVDVQVFQEFNQLIEAHFREHWQLGRYAAELKLTETRLNDICRRVADIPSKRLVHDRVLQEAKRLLLFSSASVTEIAYDLGFVDVSYFSRFFRRHAKAAPGEWREQAQAKTP